MGAAILLAVIAVGIGMWYVLPRVQPQPPSTPKIGMKLGDDWAAITASSTYPFRDIAGHKTGYATDWGAVDFAYTDPLRPLELSDARTVYFELVDDHAANIRVLQLGDPIDWQSTEARVRTLVAQLERAGWARKDGIALDEALAGRKAFYDDFPNFMNDQFLGSWFAGGARFDLSLYRTRNAGETVGGETSLNDMFVINVSIRADE